MGLFKSREYKAQRQLESGLRPYLRTRAERGADLSGLKFNDKELAAALMLCGGSIASAQRLLVRTAGIDASYRYVADRIKASPQLYQFVNALRLKSRAQRVAGRPVCQHCGGLLEPPAEQQETSP